MVLQTHSLNFAIALFRRKIEGRRKLEEKKKKGVGGKGGE